MVRQYLSYVFLYQELRRPINPYGDKKANGQVSYYKDWLTLMGALAIIRMPHI